MPPIDKISIQLGVEARDIKTAVDEANRALDGLSKSRVANVTLKLTRGESFTQLAALEAKIKEIGQVELSVRPNIDVSKIEEDIKAAIDKRGGVPIAVKLDTKLTGAEAKTTRQAIAAAIGTVTVDWQFAAQPKGGFPEPPAGGGGDGGGGGVRGGGSGGGSGGGGGAATAETAPGPKGEARTPAQRTVDQRIRALGGQLKRARATADKTKVETLQAELDEARAEQKALAKVTRGAKTATAEAKTVEAGLTGTGRAINARRATRQKPITGDPAQLGTKSVTAIAEAGRPGGQMALGAPDKGAFIGGRFTGNFRGSQEPTSGARAASELTPAGLARMQALKALGATPEELRAGMASMIEGVGKISVAEGEVPRTVNPQMRKQLEESLGAERAAAMAEWVGQYQTEGMGQMSEADAKALFRNLSRKEKRQVWERFGVPDFDEEGGLRDPLAAPGMARAFEVLSGVRADTFAEATFESGGANVRRKAGMRKGGRAGGGGQITLTETLPSSRTRAEKAAAVKANKAFAAEARKRPRRAETTAEKDMRAETTQFFVKNPPARKPVPKLAPESLEQLTPEGLVASSFGDVRVEPDKMSDLDFKNQFADARAEETVPDAKGMFTYKGRTFVSREALRRHIFNNEVPGFAEGGKFPMRMRLKQTQPLDFAKDYEGFNPFMDLPDPDILAIYDYWASLDQGAADVAFGAAKAAFPEDVDWLTGDLRGPGYEMAMGLFNKLHPDFVKDNSIGKASPFGRPFNRRAARPYKLSDQPYWSENADGGSIWDKQTWADARAQRQAAALAARDQDRNFGVLADPQIDKLKAMADQTASPNEAEIAKRMLHEKGVPGYAEGGGLVEPGGYSRMPGWRRRLNAARLHMPSIVMQEAASEELGREYDALEDILADIGDEMQTVVPRLSSPDWANLYKPGQGTMEEALRAAGFPFSKNAEGGRIKHDGTRDRPAGVTMVGERGPELIVNDAAGNAEVIPTHQMSTWLARHGMAEGGLGPGRNMRGVFGTVPAAQLNKGTIAAGDILRVFVVNWPTSFKQGEAPAAQSMELRTRKTKASEVAAIMGDPVVTRAAASMARGQLLTGNPKGVLPTVEELSKAQPSPVLRPTQDPLFRAQLEQQFRRERFSSRETLQAERTRVSVALAENPVRAFAVAFSQFIQTKIPGGRGQLLERAGEARVAIQEAEAAQADFIKTSEKLSIESAERRFLVDKKRDQGLSESEEKELGILNQLIPARQEAQAFLERESKTTLARAQDLATAEKLGGTGEQLKNLGVGLVSVIGGGLVLRTAFAGFAATLDITARAVGDVVERNTDYRNSTASLSSTLADATRQQKGSATAATAAAFAVSGLADATSERLLPALSGRAGGVAGNRALQEQIIQIAAGGNVGLNRPAGLPEGFDTSLVRATGGPFDMGLLPGILSERSTSDILRNSLPSTNVDFQRQMYDAQRPFILGGPLGVGIRAGPDFEAPSPEKLGDLLDQWVTDTAARGVKGGAIDQLARTTETERAKATIQAFRNIGANDFADALQERLTDGFGLAFQGPEISDFIAAQFLDAQSRAGLRPSAGNLITQLTSTIGGVPREQGGLSELDVTLRDIRRRGAFQRDAVLPAQQALAFANQPLTPFNDRRLRPSGVLPGMEFADTEDTIGQYQAAFEKYAQYAVPAQERINAQVSKGRAILSDWIGPDLLGDITDLGQSIRDIQLGIQQRSLNLEVSQYNNELRIATRNLQSAKDFAAAIKGNVRDTTGALQGQNFQLGRRLQLLQQELQQRQINLQLAVAGFQVAGETPEERAARQDAAQAEANFAQRQLDLQKQMSSNEFTIGLKENANAITDLTAQIALLREGKALAIDSFAAEEAIKSMQAELDILNQEAQERFDEAIKMSDVQMGIIADIERASGEMFDRWQNKLFPAFRHAGREAGKAATDFVVASILTAFATSLPNTKEMTTKPGSNKPVPLASGMLFDTTGPTNMVVGEAGTETVAVLRNPRQMQTGGGGGGGITVHINLNGDIRMRNEADIAMLADKIEERLSRRLQMTRR